MFASPVAWPHWISPAAKSSASEVDSWLLPFALFPAPSAIHEREDRPRELIGGRPVGGGHARGLGDLEQHRHELRGPVQGLAVLVDIAADGEEEVEAEEAPGVLGVERALAHEVRE